MKLCFKYFMKGMDQNMKKFLTFVLIAAMMLSMIVVSTSAEAWDGTTVSAALTGEGTAEKPYLVATAADLAFLAKSVNEGTSYEGQYITQTADIDLGNKEWTPIGNKSKPFKGVYDGCDKKITGFYIAENKSNSIGLFGAVYPTFKAEAGVANVNLKGAINLPGANATNNAGIGGLVGNVYSDATRMFAVSIINCVVDVDITITGCPNQPRVGGVAGFMFTGYIENVVYNGTINYTDATANSRVGGILGQGNRFAATNCVNNGDITVTHNDNGANVGGIIGMQTTNGDPETQYINCVNNGKLNVTIATPGKSLYAGGIVGGIYSGQTIYNASIKNCLNTGDISATSASPEGVVYAAGMLTRGNKTFMHVTNSVNTALVMALGATTAYAGGIGGSLETADSPYFTVENCITLGDVAGQLLCTNAGNKGDATTAELEAAAKVITDALTKSAIRINGFPTSDVPLPETTAPVETTKKPKETTAKPEEATKAPEATTAKSDEATKAPVTTEAPKPQGGCGSIVGGGLAVVALVGIAVIVSKKKD